MIGMLPVRSKKWTLPRIRLGYVLLNIFNFQLVIKERTRVASSA